MAASSSFRLGSFLLSSIAALTIGLGISVFVSTYFLLYGPYCGYSYYGCTYSVPGVMAFILPGVWGSIGVFASGILGMKAFKDPQSWRAYASIVALITAVFFLPAMIALSVAQAVTVTQTQGASPALYSVTANFPSQNILLYILPVLVATLGGLEWLILLGVFVYSCCYLSNSDAPGKDEPRQPVPFGAVPYSPYGVLPYRRPLGLGAGPAPFGPYAPSGPLAIRRPDAQYAPYGPLGIRRPDAQYTPYGPLAGQRPVPPPVIDPRRVNAYSPYGALPYRRQIAPYAAAFPRPY